MRDRLTKQRRSWNMSRIRGKDTSPELRVRSALHRLGFRFRLHGKKLPGRPDIVLGNFSFYSPVTRAGVDFKKGPPVLVLRNLGKN